MPGEEGEPGLQGLPGLSGLKGDQGQPVRELFCRYHHMFGLQSFFTDSFIVHLFDILSFDIAIDIFLF